MNGSCLRDYLFDNFSFCMARQFTAMKIDDVNIMYMGVSLVIV